MEVMRFCQSFMTELYRHIGQFVDCPAGDIGVGGREVGYMFGQYKRLTNSFQGGMLTGKGLTFGGSLVRTEATGYGLCYFTAEALKCMRNDSFAGKTVVISGSGNVAIYACEKATQLGGKVVTMSDSNGYVYDPNGIDLAYVKDLKEVRRGRIKEYAETHPSATYVADCTRIWETPCDIALPCATQNELPIDGAKALVANGCYAVAEGANMPSTPEAVAYLQANNVLFAPAKASNAGGVATSGLEMSQNSLRLSWTFDEVDARLKDIMKNIYANAAAAAETYGMKGNLVAGANIAGFPMVADAMPAQVVVYSPAASPLSKNNPRRESCFQPPAGILLFTLLLPRLPAQIAKVRRRWPIQPGGLRQIPRLSPRQAARPVPHNPHGLRQARPG